MSNMSNNPHVTVEPLTYGMTGFKVEDLVSQRFLEEIRKEMGNSVIAAIVIGFTDSKELVSISHDRKEGKTLLERVDVEGTEPISVRKAMEALKRVFA